MCLRKEMSVSKRKVSHDNVLLHIVNWLSSKLHSHQKLYADLDAGDVASVHDLFSDARPDIAIIVGNAVNIL